MSARQGILDRGRVTSVRSFRSFLQNCVKFCFITFVVRPIFWLLLGPEVRNAARLPKAGPAILIANHNSHFDALAILTALHAGALANASPVGAEDYFFGTPRRAWFSRWFLGIVPVARKVAKDDPRRRNVLDPVVEAVHGGSIVIFFPEGSRGKAGRVGPFKRGIQELAKRCPGVPIIPLYLAGFNKVLPKDTFAPVPFLCSITVGEAVIASNEENLHEALHDKVVELGGQAELRAAAGASSSVLVAARSVL